jgi:hypothetical protein
VSVAARLALFGAAIVVVFAVASVAGAALDAGPGTEQEEDVHGEEAMAMPAEEAEHGDEHSEGTAPVGLAVAEAGYRLELTEDDLQPGRRGTLAFRVLDEDGHTVQDFETEHERRMHLIVVRRDLTGFQHLHPEQRPDGSWRTEMSVEDAGDYRVYADFVTAGEPLTLASDMFVPGEFQPRALPAERDVADAGDGYRVRVEETGEDELTFAVSKDGKRIDGVQPYLGADGHLVVLREGDGAFLHAHPLGEPGGSGPIRFMVEYPSAGAYRLFLQFKHDGEVHTAAFTRHDGGHSHE